MTQDEIIEMARDTASHGTHANGETIYTFYLEQLEAFAKLVVEKEQDGNCKKCKDGCPACDARKLPNDLL